MNDALRQIHSSFRDANGVVGVLLSLILSVSLVEFGPDLEVSLYWAFPILYFMYVLGLAVWQGTKVLPRVRWGGSYQLPSGRKVPLLVLDPTALLGHDAAVSAYRRDSRTGVERIIGLGYVLTIQEDRRPQVVMELDLTSDGEFWTNVMSNDGASLKELIVKPSIPRALATLEISDSDGEGIALPIEGED